MKILSYFFAAICIIFCCIIFGEFVDVSVENINKTNGVEPIKYDPNYDKHLRNTSDDGEDFANDSVVFEKDCLEC